LGVPHLRIMDFRSLAGLDRKLGRKTGLMHCLRSDERGKEIKQEKILGNKDDL